MGSPKVAEFKTEGAVRPINSAQVQDAIWKLEQSSVTHHLLTRFVDWTRQLVGPVPTSKTPSMSGSPVMASQVYIEFAHAVLDGKTMQRAIWKLAIGEGLDGGPTETKGDASTT